MEYDIFDSIVSSCDNDLENVEYIVNRLKEIYVERVVKGDFYEV